MALDKSVSGYGQMARPRCLVGLRDGQAEVSGGFEEGGGGRGGEGEEGRQDARRSYWRIIGP